MEEFLRLEPPSPVAARHVVADVALHGTTMHKGSRVAVLFGSAGRDGRHYPAADTPDIHRRTDRHLSFGRGIHACLGAAQAGMEAPDRLEETLRRWPEWGSSESGQCCSTPVRCGATRGTRSRCDGAATRERRL